RGCRAAGGKDYERNPYRIKASSSEPDFFRIRSSAYGEIKNHEAVEQERTERYIRKQRESGYSCGIELNDCDRDNGKSSSEPCQNPFLLKNPLILGVISRPPTNDKRCGRDAKRLRSAPH